VQVQELTQLQQQPCGQDIATFTVSGSLTASVISGSITTFDYIVVAGGAGSGGGGAGYCYTSGGGGAGGYRASSFPLNSGGKIKLATGAYPITVGAGGAGGPTSNCVGGNLVLLQFFQQLQVQVVDTVVLTTRSTWKYWGIRWRIRRIYWLWYSCRKYSTSESTTR
jgi:hypothetical protein